MLLLKVHNNAKMRYMTKLMLPSFLDKRFCGVAVLTNTDVVGVDRQKQHYSRAFQHCVLFSVLLLSKLLQNLLL